MPSWHVAAGNRNEACQARLRGEQVITIGIEAAIGNPIADREELARGLKRNLKSMASNIFRAIAPIASRRPLNDRAAAAERLSASSRASSRTLNALSRPFALGRESSARLLARVCSAAVQRPGRSASVGTASKILGERLLRGNIG